MNTTELEQEVLNEIYNLQDKIPYLDYVKSDYMLQADNLHSVILNPEYDSSLQEEEIERISNYLSNAREELFGELIEYMDVMNTLEHSINRWKHQELR